MIDGDKHRDLPLTGEGCGQVGAPHRVHRRGNDGAVVGARASGRADPGGREQVVRAHEPQDPALGRANARHAQPGPDLPVPLAVKRALGQDGADRLQQGRIRHRPNRARTPRRFGPGEGEMPIHAGPRRAPDPAHAGQAIGLAACGRDGPAHRRDLRRAKGRLASRAAILASSNSRSSSISPSLALSRSFSSASPSVDRVARLASPAATKVSCHPVRVAAVAPSARESVSRSSPRNRRSTASRLRLRDMRPPRPRPTPPEATVSVVIIITLLRIMSALKDVSANRGADHLLASAILAGASQQLRNMASTGGNLLQRTRCFYFYDATTPCNKRVPGSGCSAIDGVNRINAILGTSEACIATHPSDMCVALAALDATVHVAGPAGMRTIAFADFHRLPGDTPQRDTNLNYDEIITAVELPAKGFSANYSYVKIRDRLSYAFALVSVAAALELENDTIKDARLALGGVAHKPWRSPAAETVLRGQRAEASAFGSAADVLLRGAKGFGHNDFKIGLARRAIVRTLGQAAQATPQSISDKRIR